MLILDLLQPHRNFPEIWVPSVDQRDVRALLCHRHQLVRLRTQVQNALQAIALSHGLRKSQGLWSKAGLQALAAIPLPAYTAERRMTAIDLQQQLQSMIDELDGKVAACAAQRPLARLLMTHPGVGPNTALATETILGDPSRFANPKKLCSYVGLIPEEDSSANKYRLGKLTKQGSAMLRFLWCEAAGTCGTQGRAIAALLSSQARTEGTGEGQSGVRTQTRRASLDHAARSHRL